MSFILTAYIITVWRTRKENLRIGKLKTLFINRVMENIKIRKEILEKTREEINGQYFTRLTDDKLNKL